MMMESGFSPAGLRVLVVDDDPTWLKILEKMLKKCSYEVTCCNRAREALKLLRERKDGFDIVVSDVNMPDMDGFKLLEHVGLEMDLPVIMMSVDGETSRVMKGVQHGACDYLLKPVRMKELKNIWQHVVRKRMHEVRDIESHESIDDFQLFRNAADLADDGHFFSGADQIFMKKRKDLDSKPGDKESNDPSSTKKPRVVWSVDLHQKFVKAVNQIGFDKVGPKRILDLMNVPWLTRENVASHLQKYRLYLSRLQRENELKVAQKENESKIACGGLKSSVQSPKDGGGGFGVQHHASTPQAEGGFVNLRCPDYKLPVQSSDTKPHEIGSRVTNLWALTEPRKPFNRDISDVHKATSSPQMGPDHSLGSLKPEISYAPFDCPLSSQFDWSRDVKDSLFEFEYKPHQQELLGMSFVNECKPHYRLEDCFSNQPTVHVPQQHIQSFYERENLGIIDSKLLGAEFSNDVAEQPLFMGQATEFLSNSKTCALNPEIFGPTTNISLDMNHSASQNGVPGLELGPSNHIWGSESAFGSLTDDLGLYLLQGDNFATTSMRFDDIGFTEYNFPDLISEAPSICLRGVPRFEFEHLSDSFEHTVVDQGLSIS